MGLDSCNLISYCQLTPKPGLKWELNPKQGISKISGRLFRTKMGELHFSSEKDGSQIQNIWEMGF